MSVEEDTELRDIIIETLEKRGVVGRTKAMLRASIFTALEETAVPEDRIFMLNKRIKENLTSQEGSLLAALVLEYLSFYDLEFTKMVFEPETGFSEARSRQEIAHALGLADTDDSHSAPLLAELLQRKGSNDKQLSKKAPSHGEIPKHTIQEDLSSKQISDAKAKFTKYDKDGNGSIDKNELRTLFVDMFPAFHPSMLERYVNDEFKAADNDFSSAIDFDEFLNLYRRLFVQCRSVVSQEIADIAPLAKSISPRHSKIPVKNEAPSVKKSETSDSRSVAKKLDLEQTLVSRSQGNLDSVTSGGDRLHAVKPGADKPSTEVRPAGDSKVSSGEVRSSTGQSSLGSLPSLSGKSSEPSKSKDQPADFDGPYKKSIDKRIADMGFEVPDDDDEDDDDADEDKKKDNSNYEDDFEKSNASSRSSNSHSKSRRSDAASFSQSIKTETMEDEVTDGGLDDDNDIDALLKDNDISWGNETEDKTVTDDESLKGVDYWEFSPKK